MIATAEEGMLYRWTDPNGGIQLSDRPPEVTYGDVRRIPRPVVAPPPAAERRYSIRNQAARMEAQRLQRATARAEKRRIAREQALRERELAIREKALAQRPDTGSATYLAPSPVHRRPRPPWRYHGRPESSYRGLWKPDHPAYQPRPLPAKPRGTGSKVFGGRLQTE